MNLKSNVTRFAAAALSTAVVAGSAFLPVLSQPTFATDNYTAVEATAAQYPSFNKYLVMSQGDRTPQATFAFTISAGTARAAASGKMQVLPGIFATVSGTTYPNISNAVFAADQATTQGSDATSAQIDVQRTDRSVVKLDDGEKFAVSSSTVNFANVKFPEPGIYRYIITESASTTNAAKGITHDDDTDRVLDVYVTDTNDGNNTLQISSFVLHMTDDVVTTTANNGSGDVTAAGDALTDKTDGFTNEYFSKDLDIGNQVTGNQASRDKYFEYTVSLTGLTAGDKYTVSLGDDSNAYTTDGAAHASIGANPNAATTVLSAAVSQPTELTVGSDGTITQKYYLNDLEHFVIRGLPANAHYTVTAGKEDYKQTPMAAVINTLAYGDETSATGNKTIQDCDTDDNDIVRTSFLHTRAGVIPTGVFMAAGAGILVILAGLAGIILLNVRKRRRNEA